MTNINSILDENSAWIMYSSEGSDKYFAKFITKNTIVPSASVISKNTSSLIVHELDSKNINDFSGAKIIYSSNNTLIQCIFYELKQLNYPEKIYLNYSDKMDSETDVLGHGTFRFLADNISSFYKSNGKTPPRFASADNIIYFLIESKTEDDINYMSIAANRALNILENAFKRIRPGMSEIDIANTVHNIFRFKPKYFQKYKIVKEEYSWEKQTCPIVLVGENLKCGGHSAPSNKVLKPGNTVYFDFGVKITLADGRKYSSDLQRMGYVLKRGEKNPPQEVQKVFETLTEAIKLGIENAKPSSKGYDIDKIVRDHILNAGYPNYNHATGHPIGEIAHSPGTSISPKGYKRSSLFLRENGVYTIEPRIQIENGGSIEEMVRVTKNGGIPLCPPQQKIYIIK